MSAAHAQPFAKIVGAVNAPSFTDQIIVFGFPRTGAYTRGLESQE
jgi:carbamoylphosphate synthase small subunit